MKTIEAVNEAQVIIIDAFSGHLDPNKFTVGLFNTLVDAALKWAMVEERMAPKAKADIKSGELYWVRPKWRNRWEPARFEHSGMMGLMCFMMDQVECVDDKFMQNWIIGANITEPSEDV